VHIVPGLAKSGGALLALLAMGAGVGQVDSGRQAYFRAVAEFFSMTPAEVSILGEWRLPPEEVPVVLFVARRAGVSPDALVALRRSGWGWAGLVERYHLDATHFHVPLAAGAPAGRLSTAYERFEGTPANRWADVMLEDDEVVDLVNLRVVAQTLQMSPAAVLAESADGSSWVELYGRLIGDHDLRPGGGR